jgi:hypothetical protein
MKTFTLVSSLLAVAYAAPAPAEAIGEIVNIDSTTAALDPITNPLMRSDRNGEKILPRFSMTAPKDGAVRTVVKYGNWMVSSAKMMSTLKMAKGPCTGCYVTAMEATIRYPDGKEANVDTGAWLHHIALFGSGTGGGSIWAAGNERPTLRLNTQSKFGIQFPTMFMLMIDLMSEEVKPKNLTLEINYENIAMTNSQYKQYKGATMYWLTIGEPAAKQGKYTFNTQSMSVTGAGKLLYAIGHMHDGGDNMSLKVSSSVVCKSVMHYNARAGYTPGGAAKPMAGHAHGRRDGGPHAGMDGMEHISDPGACTDFGSVKMGDRLSAVAYYDAQKHKLMVHNGKMERLMGNMRVYIGTG